MSGPDRFAAFVAQAEETRVHSVSDRSSATYQRCLRTYERTMTEEFQMEPFRLTEEKMEGFLMFKKASRRTYSTLKLYIASFSAYLQMRDEENLTVSVSFKILKNGLQRVMLGGAHPFQKEPFELEFFKALHDVMNLSVHEERLLFFLMCLSFNYFMRIGELLSLKAGSLVLDEEAKLLACHFERSKSDQLGVGVTSYISISPGINDPVAYIDVLSGLQPTDKICPWSQKTLTSRLRARLSAIGVDAQRFSWHSFRRGAAFLASKKGIQDCVIKKHGRWKSDAYLRYVAVSAVRAGTEIRAALTE